MRVAEQPREDAEQRVMDAENEARAILEDAQERADHMIDESEIMRQAREEARIIKNDARVEVVANRLNALGLTIIFPVEKSLYERLQQLGDVTYYSTPSILLGLQTSKPVGDENYMLAYFQGELVFLISMQDGKVRLANAFRCEDGHDCIYYLLSIWKELGLSQEDDALYLCGDKGVELNMMTISRFIRRCRRLNANELFPLTLLNKMEGIPFDLQTLILCE